MLQALEQREADVRELADKVEQLAQDLTERKADLATSDEEIDALTHDLQKVSCLTRSTSLHLGLT